MKDGDLPVMEVKMITYLFFLCLRLHVLYYFKDCSTHINIFVFGHLHVIYNKTWKKHTLRKIHTTQT